MEVQIMVETSEYAIIRNILTQDINLDTQSYGLIRIDGHVIIIDVIIDYLHLQFDSHYLIILQISIYLITS